jgi:hemerythrin
MNVLYIVWKDECNLGIPIIDEQHRAIVATINSLFYFIQEGWGIEVLTPTLTIIKHYSAFHFKTEAGVLAKIEYPELQEHVESQKKFAMEIDVAAQEAIEYKDPALLLKFIKDWWLNHLHNEHQQYAPCLDRLKV